MKTINEELNYMKYLFGYQKGVIISEQAPATTGKTGVEQAYISDSKFFPNNYMLGTQKTEGVLVKFDHDKGTGVVAGNDGTNILRYDVTCSCRNPGVNVNFTINSLVSTVDDGSGQGKYTGKEIVEASPIWSFFKPKCIAYLNKTNPACNTNDAARAQSGNLDIGTLGEIVNLVKTNAILPKVASYKNSICMYLNSKQYENMSEPINLSSKSYIDQILKEPSAYGPGAKNEQGGELTNNDLYNLEFSGRAKKFCGT